MTYSVPANCVLR